MKNLLMIAFAFCVTTSMSARAADEITIEIVAPTDGAAVDHREEVKGRVSDPNANVWVVIRPTETSDFWVQPPVSVKKDGSWKVKPYFGDAGRNVGSKFEVRAFVNPSEAAKEGKTDHWLKATVRSDLIEVVRQ